MSESDDKAPLKNRTAWSHLETVKKAREEVSSWPRWKRETVVFRGGVSCKDADNSGDNRNKEDKKRSA
jgi:hypothetical protein